MFLCEIFNILFSYEDKDIGRFSNLHQCTFNVDSLFCKIIISLSAIIFPYFLTQFKTNSECNPKTSSHAFPMTSLIRRVTRIFQGRGGFPKRGHTIKVKRLEFIKLPGVLNKITVYTIFLFAKFVFDKKELFKSIAQKVCACWFFILLHNIYKKRFNSNAIGGIL